MEQKLQIKVTGSDNGNEAENCDKYSNANALVQSQILLKNEHFCGINKCTEKSAARIW